MTLKIVLSYEGDLYSFQGDKSKEQKLKAEIRLRRCFHSQLKGFRDEVFKGTRFDDKKSDYFIPLLADKVDHNFLRYRLDIFIHRPRKNGMPPGVYNSDTDNLVKWVVDCLKIPDEEKYEKLKKIEISLPSKEKLPEDRCFSAMNDDNRINELNIKVDEYFGVLPQKGDGGETFSKEHFCKMVLSISIGAIGSTQIGAIELGI